MQGSHSSYGEFTGKPNVDGRPPGGIDPRACADPQIASPTPLRAIRGEIESQTVRGDARTQSSSGLLTPGPRFRGGPKVKCHRAGRRRGAGEKERANRDTTGIGISHGLNSVAFPFGPKARRNTCIPLSCRSTKIAS